MPDVDRVPVTGSGGAYLSYSLGATGQHLERSCCELLTFHPHNIHLTQAHSSRPTHTHTHSIILTPTIAGNVIDKFSGETEKVLKKRAENTQYIGIFLKVAEVRGRS